MGRNPKRMPNEVVYRWGGYSEKYHCHFVEEYRNGSHIYTFRAYTKGNKVTLYPHKPMYTTQFKRDKMEMSIFDIKR